MTPQQFKATREHLGLTQAQMGRALGLGGDPGRCVRRYEAGDIEIGGTVAILMRYMAAHGLDKASQAVTKARAA